MIKHKGGEIVLKVEEIKQLIIDDSNSKKKKFAMIGQEYYEGDHDIKNHRLFYFNADVKAEEDTIRSNVKISHPFFTELVDQATQYILSGDDGIIKSDIPELQAEMDFYFNDNEDFTSELSEAITDCQTKGFAFMHSFKNEEDRTTFQCADALGVVEVEARFASDKKEHIIYHYVDRIDNNGKKVTKIIDFDDECAYFYTQIGDGEIKKDENEIINPMPYNLYKKKGSDEVFRKSSQVANLPFYRLYNNKKQQSCLKPIKALIDDYDLMACGLTNNIQDAAEYLVVVSGFNGDDLEELMQNSRIKKHIGVEENGGVEFKTINIPYEARKAKLELDEKSIYRFGMGLNTSGLKDTAATTNIAIKAAYSLLDLKCSKLVIRLKQFLRKLIKVVLQEINEINGTDYQMKDVYFNFKPEIMSNEQENKQNELTEAQTRQMEVNTLLNIAAQLDNETLMQLICEQLDIDYEEIKGKLPDPQEAVSEVITAQKVLDSVAVEEGGNEDEV